MISKRLKQYLQDNNVNYEVVPYPDNLLQRAVVEGDPITPNEIAKVRIFKKDYEDVMVVLPSNCALDLEKLKFLLNVHGLAEESGEECSHLFPDCECGAIPPLGEMYNIPCYVDETLLDGGNVFFSSGNNKESVKMSSDEFLRISHAEVGDFRVHRFES